MRKITLNSIAESIDSLAISTKNSFDHIEKVFNERFEKIEMRLDRIEGVRYNNHETRIENLEDSLRTVKNRLKLK